MCRWAEFERVGKDAAGHVAGRGQAAEAVSQSLAPGLRTRAFIYNTLVFDKSSYENVVCLGLLLGSALALLVVALAGSATPLMKPTVPDPTVLPLESVTGHSPMSRC